MKKKLLRFPKVLELDYKKWICGGGLTNPTKKGKAHGKGVTCLNNNLGFQCCLGQFSEQAGVPVEKLGCSMPADIEGYDVSKEANERFYKAADINDELAPIAQKVVSLRGVFRRNQIKLKNFPKRIQEQIARLEKKKK